MPAFQSRRTVSPLFIGIFVITGTLAIIGTIIWLGANQFFKENVYYVTYVTGSVSGLEPGSPVKYMGVPSGSVKHIGIAPDGKLIEVVMTIDSKIKVDQYLRAKVEFSGLAGGKFIQLHYPSDPAIQNNHPELSFKPPYKLIQSSPSGIEEIETATRDVLTKLTEFKYGQLSDEMITFLQNATGFFKNDELYSIISNLNQSSERMNSILGKADTSRIINNLEITSQRLIVTVDKLEKFADSLNYQLYGLDLSHRVDKAFVQYDSAMHSVRNLLYVLGYRLDNTIFNLDATLGEFRHSNRVLQKALKVYSTDPGRLLLGEPPPPEK